jgi:hypothetical protein
MQTEYDYEHCYDCGKHESEESGGLTTYEGEHESFEVCDECYRQRIEDDEAAEEDEAEAA